MSRLVVAANRGPVTLGADTSGRVVAHHGAGGLAPSLARALPPSDVAFVAAAMNPVERAVARNGWPAEVSSPCAIRLVDISEQMAYDAYNVVANETLWYLYHGLFDHARRPLLDAAFRRAFAGYRAFNAAFADAIAAEADEGATVVVHDYHLALVGAHLARARPDLATVHFSHTPFCTPEELSILPEEIQRELIGAMAAFGACGFHTARWAARFARCAAALEIDLPAPFDEPLGTDAAALRAQARSPSVAAATERLVARVGGRRIIVRSDRIELSKNLLRGFHAYAELLENWPQYRGEVVFVARGYSSRQGVADYASYQGEVETLVRAVNARFAVSDWTPILLEFADDFDATLAAFGAYDVLLVNPIRDGMNLVAKEGPVLNERAGVLVLSREAGAFEELRDEVVPIAPFDVSATAVALAEALSMPPAERAARAERLRARLEGTDTSQWLEAVAARARRPGSAA